MSLLQEITTPATPSATETAKDTGAADIMGKEDFLTLLVTQLQNQDPLNPDDPTEFTAQLAQFSSLEQLFNMNESMDNLVTSNANADKFSTLQTIGKNVAYQSSKFEYDGKSGIELGYQLDGTTTEAQITVQRNGAAIAVIEGTDLTKGNHFVTWDGLDMDGNEAGPGNYTFSISVKAVEGESVAASPLVKAEVTGVDLTGDYGGRLTTKAGEVDFASILGVFDIESSVQEDATEATEDTTTHETVASSDSSSSSSQEKDDNIPAFLTGLY